MIHDDDDGGDDNELHTQKKKNQTCRNPGWKIPLSRRLLPTLWPMKL